MDRTTLQQLPDLRLKDSEALLASGRWEAAYYLAGYSIECALKACVAKQFLLHNVPDKKLVSAFYTHRLDELLVLSGLSDELEVDMNRDPDFAAAWKMVRTWSENARYEIGLTEGRARIMCSAAIGILLWMKTQW